ncbi:hypothetical protein T484DRAFT_1846860 [Baffinella frigidus]|nr:hypothetical protein T484DRAFT_1846860 [Cryptophyta sp. CCMP2293]
MLHSVWSELRARSKDYEVHVGNNGFADRLWRLMALGLTVFKVDNGWKEFYYDLLVPWEHYIPVNASLSDLCERLAWARTHPDEAKRIGTTVG